MKYGVSVLSMPDGADAGQSVLRIRYVHVAYRTTRTVALAKYYLVVVVALRGSILFPA